MASGKGTSESRTSTNTTTVSTQETYNTVDNRAVQGDDARIGGNVSVIGAGGPVRIETTDQGAVQAGLDLSLESLSTVRSLTAAQQDATRDTISNAFTLADRARQSETSNAIQSFLKYGTIVLVVGLLAWALTRGARPR